MLASGKCEKAAQDLVKNFDSYQQRCHGRGTKPEDMASCRQFSDEKNALAVCAVPPDDPERGYKRRAIQHDPMPTAFAMAQQRPQE